jgi:hypothetical protein
MAFFGAKKAERSAMADFIRSASSAQKKKVYREVLIKATKRQEEVIRRAPSGQMLKCVR